MSIRNTLLPLIFPAIVLLPVAVAAQAQDKGPDFENHGEATVGYRFTDIQGYRPQYLQMFDLRKGFRLQDFTLRGKAKEGSGFFADSYSARASGLGGDPFATAEVKVAKNNRYELRMQWRQSYYYWNQNDDVALPISTAASGLSKGLTDNHDWATVRKMGSTTLTIHATNALRFNLDFFRTTTDGSLLTTRSLDFFNAPTYWGGFARANPYPLNAPLRDETNRFAGGVDYSWRAWDFHYKAGVQSFNETVSLHAVKAAEVSINPIALSTNEPLNQISWEQTRRLTTPVSEFSYRGTINEWLEWRGGYIYSRFRGPAALDMSFSGIAPASNGALTPYSVTEGSRASVIEPSHAVNQGFTARIKSWWSVNMDYRYTRYSSEATSTTQSLFNGTTASQGTADVIWESGLSDVDLNMLFTLGNKLTFRPGLRYSKSDIETAENGVVDDARTLRTKHVRPELRVGYKPFAKLSVRGDLHSSTSSASYNAITPHTRVAGHVIVRYEPLENLSIENSLSVSTAKLEDANYHNRVRANTVTISYARSEKFSAFGSMGYDSFFADGDIIYARGTSPLKSVIRDQEIHRIWQAGVELQPIRWMGVRLSGDYDRLTGKGEIVGEPPAYGPLTWPVASGTVYFNLPKTGKLSLDLQRTYYVEELVPVNNFSANLLTIRFTRTF